jgi:glycosyltransferase involved in cell wall biosynthesis
VSTAAPLVVFDADALGRERTGDETYVENLLREAGRIEHELRLAAVTRFPARVPAGVEPVHLPARSQIVRMSVSAPRVLRRLRPALVHFQHALPLGLSCPGVVTVHDLSFERQPGLMRFGDRLVFRTAVPRSVRRAARVIAVSERTKRDLVDLYRAPAAKIAVIPNGIDPVFRPGENGTGGYALLVGAIQARKNPLAAAEAAARVGLPLVAAGPARDAALARELGRRGVVMRGYVTKEELAELYRGAACLLFPSRYEGFGLPVLEAMASGTPVVAADEAALREVAGDAAVFAPPDALAEGIERALRERETLVLAGLERARLFSWETAARRTLAVYREVLA